MRPPLSPLSPCFSYVANANRSHCIAFTCVSASIQTHAYNYFLFVCGRLLSPEQTYILTTSQPRTRKQYAQLHAGLQGLLLSLSAICMFMVSLMISHLEPVHIPPAKLTLNLEALDLQHVQTPSPQQVGTTLERRNSAGPTSLPPASTLPHLPISLSPRGPRTTTPGGAAPVVLARGTPRSARGGDRSTVIGDWGEDSPAFTGVRAERPESLNGSPPYTPTGAPPWGDHKHRRSLSRRSASASRKGVRGHQPPLRGLRAWRACLLWTLPWMRQCAPLSFLPFRVLRLSQGLCVLFGNRISRASVCGLGCALSMCDWYSTKPCGG